ncbi:hypothetical protein RIN66_11880 [Hafnia alvei]|uniref:hypothetical protein n=1 Tax=Hafnia alvei TaxID=569 RepID=UPI0028BD5A68|nr:hypothetical protein [Hafnia alvei]WNN50789.1 hypothetical protein RIN66_11880 [Hafnia alvei]
MPIYQVALLCTMLISTSNSHDINFSYKSFNYVISAISHELKVSVKDIIDINDDYADPPIISDVMISEEEAFLGAEYDDSNDIQNYLYKST